MKYFILWALLTSSVVFAIPERDFPVLWQEEALPYFKNLEKGYVINSQGMKLRYHYHSRPHHLKNLVIVPGRTEPAIKYAELIYDLKDEGFNIFIMDHQGQGESPRLLKDSHKGHVKEFSDYVEDFTQFINEVVIPRSSGENFLIAHSMGGTISTYFMNQNPDFFSKAVLSAPMFELDTRPYTEEVARILSKLLTLTGQGTRYAPDRGPYVAREDTFELNEHTQSENRFRASKFLFTSFPRLTLGGPTSRWVNQSLEASRKVTTLAQSIRTPILLLQAEKDLVVKPGRQKSFCLVAPCQMVIFPGSYHEILMEKDTIRDEALREIRVFFGL